MKIFVFFGPPGAGKGTQAAKMAENYGMIHVSTGDILREEIAKNTPIGIITAKLIDKGNFARDEDILKMVDNYLDDNMHHNGIVFDGIPRNMFQIEPFNKILKSKGLKIDAMISLDVSENELTDRILKRAETSGRPDDGDRGIIKKRFGIYNDQTLPIIKHCENMKNFIKIDGLGTIDEIFSNVCSKVEEIVTL